MKEDKTLVMRENLVKIASMVKADFRAKPITLDKLSVRAKGKLMRVIVCENEERSTKEEILPVQTSDGFVESDIDRDILKLVVIDTSHPSSSFIAFLKGTGLQLGAVAESIAKNDHHQIIAVGATDFELMEAINTVIRQKGGIAVTCLAKTISLPLPSKELSEKFTEEEIEKRQQEIEKKIKSLHTPMESLLYTLSFVSMPTTPSTSIFV